MEVKASTKEKSLIPVFALEIEVATSLAFRAPTDTGSRFGFDQATPWPRLDTKKPQRKELSHSRTAAVNTGAAHADRRCQFGTALR